MGNIWNNPSAFAPMFDEHVSIEAVRPSRTIRGTFAACVMPVSIDDPFAETEAESKRLTVSVLLAKRGADAWNDRTAPQIGDKITIEAGVMFAVTKVNPLVSEWYEIEARSC